MKTNVKHIIASTITLLVSQLAMAQGITYLSSLSPNSTGNVSLGSDSWLAAGFHTGNSVNGYFLDSVELGMSSATGSPSGFTVMIYVDNGNPAAGNPGDSLGVLNGPADPSLSGIYVYTDNSSIILSPNTFYYVVLNAATLVATGAYEWNESTFPPNSTGGWGDLNALLYSNNDNSSWSVTPYLGVAQFAITATHVPEPSAEMLLGLGGILLLGFKRCRKF